MAANPRKAKSKQASNLAEALNFITPATSDDGQPYAAHARFVNGLVVASNGVTTAGYPVEEELTGCPHVGRFKSAITRATGKLQIAETDNGQVSVKGARLRAQVPCVPPETMPSIMPDPRIADIDERIKEGFAALLPLIAEEGESVIETSICLRASSMVATNRTVIFEYWHGIDLPPALAIPKAAAKAVATTKLELTGFGFTEGRSVTFWFDNGAFLKTQLYEDQWSDKNLDDVLNVTSNPVEVPKDLFTGIEAVGDFSPDGAIHFRDDKIKSDYASFGEEGKPSGATYDLKGLQSGHSFTTKLIKLIKPVCDKLDYTTHKDRATFFGLTDKETDKPKLRGVIMKRG